MGESLVTFLTLLAGGGAILATVSSFLMQVIKRLFPSVENEKAKYVSILLAVIASIVAKRAIPFAEKLSPDILALWSYAVYIFQQIIWDWLSNVNGVGFFVWKKKGVTPV